jgi:hypothetical protein
VQAPPFKNPYEETCSLRIATVTEIRR